MNRLAMLAIGVAATTLVHAGALPRPAAADTTVTMWTFLNPTKGEGREVALRRIIEAFERANPGIKISVEPQVWSTLAQKFVLGSGSGQAPDISWILGQDFGLVADAKAAADLNPLIFDRWSKAERADLAFTQAYQYAAYDGRQLGVPIIPYAVVLFYRKDLFAEAGLSLESIRTWDGFIEAARKLTRHGAGQAADRWGVTLPLSQDRPIGGPATTAFMEQSGNILDKKCRASFANDAGRRSLQLQVDMITRHKIASPEDLSRHNDDSFDLFLAGRAAMIAQSFARYGSVVQKAPWGKDGLGLAPWPGLTADKRGPAVASAWFASVWDKSPRKAEAARFVEFMVGKEASMLWTEHGGLLPLRHSVAALPEFAGPKYAHLKDAMKIMSETGVFPPSGCNVSRSVSDFNLATQRVIVGKVAPIDALKEAEQASNKRQ